MTVHLRLPTLAAAFLSVALIAGHNAHAEEAQTPMLTVSGEGQVAVVPDIAIVTMGVHAEAATAAEALSANSASLQSVIDTILTQGVVEKDIGTSSFSIRPIHKRQRPNEINEGPPPIVGYAVSNQVRVLIRNIAASGDLLDKVVKAGANRINGINFDIDDPQAASDDALADAIADARRKAEIMAAAADVKLVRIVGIQSGSSPARPVFQRAMAVQAEAVPVMPGQRDVTTRATVTWEIAPR